MDKNRFLIELSESNRTEIGRVDFADQSDAQKVFSAVWVLESQVNNGGFIQYFDNDRGETASFAPIALRRIGANMCADIVERAIHTVCNGSFPTDPEASESLMAGISDETQQELESLDSQFYKYPDNLTELLFEFVSTHPYVFGSIINDQ